jgi:hypothetical protein
MLKFNAIWNLKKVTKTKNNNSISFTQPKTGISPFLGIPKRGTKKTSKLNMDWYQAKARYPKMNPYADADRDGVPNIMDCKPFNKKKQDGPMPMPQSIINPAIQAAANAARAASVGTAAPVTAIAKNPNTVKKVTSAVSKVASIVSNTIRSTSPTSSIKKAPVVAPTQIKMLSPSVPKTSIGIKSPNKYAPTPLPSNPNKTPTLPPKSPDKGFYRDPGQGRLIDPGFDRKPPQPRPPFGNPFQPTPPTPRPPKPGLGPGIPMPYPLPREKPKMILLEKKNVM